MESSRLLLRPAEEEDFVFLLTLYNKKENMQYILDGRHHWNLADIQSKRQLLNTRLEEGIGLQVVIYKEHRQLVGEAGILRLERTTEDLPEIGFMLDSAYRGSGLGNEIVSLLLRYSFSQLALLSLRAGVVRENKPSRHLLEKWGFQYQFSKTNLTGSLLDYFKIDKETYFSLHSND